MTEMTVLPLYIDPRADRRLAGLAVASVPLMF
jgi:hypothetical protein